jgi:hypothetical protein
VDEGVDFYHLFEVCRYSGLHLHIYHDAVILVVLHDPCNLVLTVVRHHQAYRCCHFVCLSNENLQYFFLDDLDHFLWILTAETCFDVVPPALQEIGTVT